MTGKRASKMVVIGILKKEVYKFFSNRKTVFTIIFLPGLVVWIVFSLMGRIVDDSIEFRDINSVIIYTIDAPVDIEEYFASIGLSFTPQTSKNVDLIKENIREKKKCILVVFNNCIKEKNDIRIYYNSSVAECKEMFIYIPEVLNFYETEKYNLFQYNTDDETYDLSTDNNGIMAFVSSVMPMLLLGLVFSASMSIAAESIAGEKERGTLNTLLMTPIPRGRIAIGKVLSICIIASCSALSSYVGTMMAIPSLTKSSVIEVLTTFGIRTQLMLFIVLVSTVLIMVSIMSVVSATSRTVKEATTSLAPFTAFSLLIGLTCLSDSTITSRSIMYILPFYNSVQLLYGIFKQSELFIHVVITVCSNLFYAILAIVVLTNILRNEKYMSLN